MSSGRDSVATEHAFKFDQIRCVNDPVPIEVSGLVRSSSYYRFQCPVVSDAVSHQLDSGNAQNRFKELTEWDFNDATTLYVCERKCPPPLLLTELDMD